MFTLGVSRQGAEVDERPGRGEKKATEDGRERSAKSKGLQETAVLLARISGIGWFVAGSIGAGVVVGWWLDRQFDTEPVLLLVGLLLGVIAAFAGMIKLLSAFGRQRTKR